MAAQAVMGKWLIAAIFFGVCVTPRATHNITRNGARMGMPAILPIAGHSMRFVSRTPIKDRARTLGVQAESAKWSMRDFGLYVVAAIWKPCVSVLMNLTGPRTVRAADYQRHVEYRLQADSGMAQEICFIDLCCSKTIIRDRNLVKNIRPLNVPARVAGLTGIKNITHQADLYLPVQNIGQDYNDILAFTNHICPLGSKFVGMFD